MHAECAGVLGPGYYATGLVEDVLGRLPKVEPSPVYLAGYISNVGIVTGATDMPDRYVHTAPRRFVRVIQLEVLGLHLGDDRRGRVEPELGVQPFEQLAADTIDRTFTSRRT